MVVVMVKEIIKLMRVKQWYKNLLIFLPLIFGQQIFNTGLLIATIFGFISLCFISSTNYVINDIVDSKRDARNSEKRNRPIASGKIKKWQGIILAVFLFSIGIFVAINLSLPFLFFAFALFLSTQLYSFKLKYMAFADVLTISVNFVIRTVSGNYVLSNGYHPYIPVSLWLVLCPFFLALFLATSKRGSEVLFLGNKAKGHRNVLTKYTKEITLSLMIISTSLFIAAYSIYIIFGPYPRLIFTLPFVLYLVFKLFSYAEEGKKIARNLELIFKNLSLVLTILIILLIAYFAIYGFSIFF